MVKVEGSSIGKNKVKVGKTAPDDGRDQEGCVERR